MPMAAGSSAQLPGTTRNPAVQVDVPPSPVLTKANTSVSQESWEDSSSDHR